MRKACTTVPYPARRKTSGGGGGGADIRAPRYIVGNAPAGDTADVCNFLDTGNGAAIQAAFDAAIAVPGDVYIRPGRYDLSLPGAPSLPFTTGWAQTVHGAPFLDNVFAQLFGYEDSAAVLVVGDTRTVFAFTEQYDPPAFGYVNLFNIAFELNEATELTTGNVLVSSPFGKVQGCRVMTPSVTSPLESLSLLFFCWEANNCVVEPNSPDGDYANGTDGGTTLTACIAVRVVECNFYGTDIGFAAGDNPIGPGLLADEALVESSFIYAAQRSVFCDPGLGPVSIQVDNSLLSFVGNRFNCNPLYVSNSGSVIVSDTIIRGAEAAAVYVAPNGSVKLSACEVNRNGEASGPGVYVEDGVIATREGGLVITGSRVFGSPSAVVAGPGMVITGNQILGATTGVEIPATAETDGCVITGNMFRVTGGVGVSAGGYNAAINGNVFTVVAGTGVDVVASAFRTLIVGNTISGGTAIADAGTGTITGNNIT